MIDVAILRKKPEFVRDFLAQRGTPATVYDQFLTLDSQWRSALQEVESLKMERNQSTPKGKPTAAQREALQQLSTAIKQKNERVAALESQVKHASACIPNCVLADTPTGTSEADNVIVRTVGTPPTFTFPVQSHDDLMKKRQLISMEDGAKIAGARFAVYYGKGAALERALINFMLHVHTQQHGYTEVQPPVLVHSAALEGTGQLPKFADDLFKCEGTDYWLSPTGEVQLTNLLRQHCVDEAHLPKQWVAYTPCFRKEAGSYGKDMKGLIRLHQFNKVELVHIVKPAESQRTLESLVAHAETILKLLKLPYRTVALCSADLGFSAAQTYDLEVWLPSSETYREISSCSNVLDFQARRAMIRYKCSETNQICYPHTLNGSGVAVGRCLAAILENYQQKDGSIQVPDVLRPYTGFDAL